MDAADVALYETVSRPLLRARRTWEFGTLTPGLSVLYLTRARPGMARDDYHRYWEREHGPKALRHHLGMWAYTQVSVVRTRLGLPIDGLAVTRWACPEDLAERYTDGPLGEAVIRSDAAVFTDLEGLERHRMSEEVLVDLSPGSGGFWVSDYRSVDLDCALDRAWSVLGRFGALLEWWPGRLRICESSGPERTGLTRRLTREDGSSVVERLIDYRPEERMLHVTVDEGMPGGVHHYSCRYELRATGPQRCRLHWSPRAFVDAESVDAFGAVVDREWPMVREGLRKAVTGAD